jgi:NAD(P)-dependent dehydrogenase (short-subunit alcohol dehydrogenase family)
MTLSGKTALVTGATSGIGKAIALALADAGALVVVHGRDHERASALVERIIAAGGAGRAMTADLSAGPDTVRALAAEAIEATGGVDILVNNAAVLVPAQSMTEVTDQQLHAALAVNVAAPIVLSGALAAGMLLRGNGVIINMGSNAGTKGIAAAGLYGASKATMHALTRAWADELAPSGIRVNAIAPGATLTEDNEPYREHLVALAQTFPDRRPGTADEVARLAVFLAGPDAAHIHGAVIPIDGGSTAI